MLKINIINCNTKGKLEFYTFTPSIFSKSFFFDNLLVFENVYVI